MSRIVFIGPLSNEAVRNRLQLRSNNMQNRIRGLFGIPIVKYIDIATWVSEYIKVFEKDSQNEYYIISHHNGMKSRHQQFEINGLRYDYISLDSSLIKNWLNKVLKCDEKNNYWNKRKQIKDLISSIHPDLVVVCGAENPHYSFSALDITDVPVFVILQTLLNNPERVKMNVGSPYRRKVEMKILTRCKYFGCSLEKTKELLSSINPSAIILDAGFPSKEPTLNYHREKDSFFVFYARALTKFKGLEDTLKAFALFTKRYPDVKLSLIGDLNAEYKRVIDALLEELHIVNKVVFKGCFDTMDEVFLNVQKSNVVVVPGITAPFNTTIVESMFMKLPVIMYRTDISDKINLQDKCLLCAEKGNINDLAEKMFYAYENYNELSLMVENAYKYACANYSSEHITRQLIKSFQTILDYESKLDTSKS